MVEKKFDRKKILTEKNLTKILFFLSPENLVKIFLNIFYCVLSFNKFGEFLKLSGGEGPETFFKVVKTLLQNIMLTRLLTQPK